MNKLTQQEAGELIQKAWQEVYNHTLGSYRFAEVLWYHLLNKNQNNFEDKIVYRFSGEYIYQHKFMTEPNSNIATEKFYKYFVEENDE